MREQIFLELGFEKTVVTAEESGAPTDWHYYTLDVGDLCLITSSSDEIKDDTWYCYFFESNQFKIKNETDLKDLIEVLRRCWK